jgi:hypothetical protein
MLDSQTPKIILMYINVLTLQKRWKGYMALFTCEKMTHHVQVKGIFLDKQGASYDLTDKFYTVDMKQSKKAWLRVQTGIHEWKMLMPMRNTLQEVSFQAYNIL